MRCGLLTLRTAVAGLRPSQTPLGKRNILYVTIVRIDIIGVPYKPAAVALVRRWRILTKPLVAEGLHLLLVSKVVWMETKTIWKWNCYEPNIIHKAQACSQGAAALTPESTVTVPACPWASFAMSANCLAVVKCSSNSPLRHSWTTRMEPLKLNLKMSFGFQFECFHP